MIRFSIRDMLWLTVGAIVGFLVGASAGSFLVRLIGPLVYGREFVQVGWLLAMFAAQAGAFLGAVLGALTIAKRPHLFLVTFVPIFVLLIGHLITIRVLRTIDRPRTYVVRVSGTTGAQFLGTAIADKASHVLNGTLPAEFKYKANELELAFALTDRPVGNKISVEVFIDGKNNEWKLEYDNGTHWYFRSLGYAEWAGGSSYVGGGDLSAEDADDLVRHQKMPPPAIGDDLIRQR